MSLPEDPAPSEWGDAENATSEDALPPVPAKEESRINRIAEMLPEDARAELYSVIEQTVSHSGWLPMPDDMARYEAILPGLAERIVRMPEREQEHRHRYVEESGKREYRVRRWGQNLALIGMALVLAFSTFLTLQGEVAWAGRVAIALVVAVVGIFVTGKWADVKETDRDE